MVEDRQLRRVDENQIVLVHDGQRVENEDEEQKKKESSWTLNSTAYAEVASVQHWYKR